jgi:hypothetical protein
MHGGAVCTSSQLVTTSSHSHTCKTILNTWSLIISKETEDQICYVTSSLQSHHNSKVDSWQLYSSQSRGTRQTSPTPVKEKAKRAQQYSQTRTEHSLNTHRARHRAVGGLQESDVLKDNTTHTKKVFNLWKDLVILFEKH